MSYRLDEGKGRCTYHIGVEDDGCHSLLDYPAISESAWILEGIARSLNSVVLTRRMIQNEIDEVCVVSNQGQGNNNKDEEEEGRVVISLTQDPSQVIIVDEPSVLGGDGLANNSHVFGYDNNDAAMSGGGEDEKMGEGGGNKGGGSVGGKQQQPKTRLCTEEGSYTRCELTIQRVETHLLDPSPLSLSSLSLTRTLSDFSVEGAIQGTDMKRDRGKSRGGSVNLPAIIDTDVNGMSEDAEDDIKNSNSTSPKSINLSRPSDEEMDIHNKNNNNDDDDTKPISVEETLSSRNVRVAVVGNVDAGKSTLIGTLTTSFLDDGRGSSRTAIMKHRHEIESGRTSTSSSHLLGFKRSGEAIAGCDRIRAAKLKGEDEIARSSYRIVTLMDLAGHEKYLKTTIHGVSSGMADYGLILVNSRHPPTHMTQHHLNLCCSYGIPIVVVFTKVDGCPDHALDTSKKELAKLLKSPEIGRRPYAIKTDTDVLTVIGKLNTLAPTIDISCVTGEGLDLLRKILFALPKRRKHEKKLNRPFEFLVEDVFNNVPGVGSVVSGFVNAGELHVGTAQVYVGPTDDGTFLRTTAKSAHIARINTSHVTAGQSATIAFSLGKEMRKKLRRGMVVVVNNPTSTKEFDAEICVLKGEGTTIRKSYQAYVHILNVRQTAFARNIEIINTNALGLPPITMRQDPEGIVLRPGCRAKVRFEFAKRPEYIRPGMRMLFRDGRVRGVGIITGIPAPEEL
jgi:small GTP-binding protein